MLKPELLSPCGNMKTLIMAINNGADAVYIGGVNFGARAYAENFSNDELIKAIKYCHLYGIKVYVTANTVIFEDEIESFINYMKFLYINNVDAVIIQDIGMISLIHKLIPDLEIHASTQVNCHNDYGLRLLKDLGVKRVVLPREMSLDEINKLDTDIEKEIFIHGALCTSYSGQCLFSSLNGGRSGNRGRCAQSCRLKYNDEYLLSTKDLCTLPKIKEIVSSGINSLKIEGRMKSPEYVGYVTKIYRKAIDGDVISKDEIINLYKLFNREFTLGYLFDDDIYNVKSSNHLGYPLGKVIKIKNNKIYIKLSDDLYQEDGIRFNESHKGMIVNKLYKNDLLVNHVDKGSIAIIDNKINLKSLDTVNKTIDRNLIKFTNNTPSKKISINFKVIALCDKELTITISDDINICNIKSIKLSKAINKATTKEEIISKLNKLGNTPFVINKIDIDIDDVFIPMSLLNEIRRNLTNELIAIREGFGKKINFSYTKKIINNDKPIDSYLVRNENQLKKVLNKGRIYTEDFSLYKKYSNYDIYYKLPRIMKEFPNFENEKLLVSDLGSIYKYSKNNIVIADYPLNITNSETVNYFHSLGVKISTISPEVPNYDLVKYSFPTEKIVYGRLDLMILKKFHKNISSLNDYPIIYGDYVTVLHNKNIHNQGCGRYILYDEKEVSHLD